MNTLDAVVLLGAVAAAFVGYRVGLTTRLLSWAGLAAGIALGVLFVDDVGAALQSSTRQTRLIASLAFLFLMTVIGQTLGIAAGSLLRRHRSRTRLITMADRIAGAGTGLFSVLLVVWLLIPVFASAPGWPARAVRGSAIVRAVDRWGPEQPSSLRRLGRLVAEGRFPEVFDRLTSTDAGPPPTSGLSAAVERSVAGSVVKIEGRACDVIQQGSGFVADNSLVVTNAHVVAGESATTVITPDGRRLDAIVIAFDPALDVAVLRVPGPGLGLPVLRRAVGDVDSTGSVIGYPGGGPERESPARITQKIDRAQGKDIYDAATTFREVFVLAASLAPGDSGGPLFDQRGRVVGLAFAVDPGNSTTAYALTTSEIDKGLRAARGPGGFVPVDTGRCIAG